MKSVAVLDNKVLDKLEMEAGPSVRLKAIEDFLAVMPNRLDDACAAGRVGDERSLGDALKSLRESAGHVGANELRDLSARIEKLCRYGARELLLPMLVQLQSVMTRTEDVFTRERTSLLLSRKMSVH
jgi:HPt (histidine-containing phosphotransfer) domain-containing protein